MIECVPNISEGRRTEVILAITGALSDVRVLHVDSDLDHNRTVITFVGEADEVLEAAFTSVSEAHRLIDLSAHDGVHPWRGACDVVPFVPLTGATMDDCVDLARALKERVERELGLPAHVYGAAGDPLPAVRKRAGAGAVCIGARGFLIAYNVQLETTDLDVARRIAKEMRKLPAVRALGFPLKSRGCVQVSLNLLDYRTTALRTAFETVERLSPVPVRDSEVVGMIPESAVDPGLAEAVRCTRMAVLEGF